jgi:carbamoyl-phosphate synthase small subunit
LQALSNANADPDGNRAHNIPALDLTTGKCHITSQNHGYAVDANTLPSDWKEYFVNLNDSSNEGIIHKTRPIFGAQFHPEAKGGPLDSSCKWWHALARAK